jgi:hypothetical protein
LILGRERVRVGEQLGEAGLDRSQTSPGEEAPTIVAWTPATNARATGVSRTNSTLIVLAPSLPLRLVK